MDGDKTLKAIKSSTFIKHIPVLVVTASALPYQKKKIEEAGCDGYMAKPIDVKSFVKKVKSLLKG